MPTRGKVYQLNSEGQWEDKGTGHVQHYIANDGDGEFVILTVVDEETESEILLEHRIEVGIQYSRQGTTIITWAEPKEGDLALSFQEEGQCDEVWEQITTAQKLSGPEEPVDEFDASTVFPFPEVSNLAELESKIGTVTGTQRAAVAARFLTDGFFEDLFAVFEKIEEDKLIPEGHSLFNFVKGMFLLNEQHLLERLLSRENILTIIACLEYDPLLPTTCTYRRHRDFLAKAQFREPIPIQKPEVVSRIHLTYRITYIKDVVLLRYLDDPTILSLNSLISFNNANLLTGLLEDTVWVRLFFEQLHKLASFSSSQASLFASSSKRRATEEEGELEVADKTLQRKNLFLFLQELCLVVKTMQPPFRGEFYKNIADYDVFRAIEDALASSDPSEEAWLWLASADILTNSLIHDPTFLRTYLISRLSVPASLLSCLIEAVVSSNVDSGLADQLAQVLRMVLDPDSMADEVDKNTFLDNLYAKQVPKLVTAVAEPLQGKCNSQYQACELLSYCVHRHGDRIKQHILHNNVISKVSGLLKSPKSNIVCSAIRFLRSCLGVKDPAIARQIGSQKVLDDMFEVFLANGARYNLLNSAVIELVHFIRQENIKVLVEYLVTKHEDKFKHIQYVQTFQELKLRYEQNQEYFRERPGSRHRQALAAPMDGSSEYSYFERDSDEENDSNRLTAEEEERRREFKLQTEMLMQKRPRLADDEADLVTRSPVVPRRKPPVRPININVGKRGNSPRH